MYHRKTATNNRNLQCALNKTKDRTIKGHSYSNLKELKTNFQPEITAIHSNGASLWVDLFFHEHTTHSFKQHNLIKLRTADLNFCTFSALVSRNILEF